jgi:hypothetical protein
MTDYVKIFDSPSDPRLGRNVRHDPRSWRYAFEAADINTLSSVKHQSQIPTLDQGRLGSSTGNAAHEMPLYEPFWSEPLVKAAIGSDATADEAYAVGVYSDATKLDDYPGVYPPTDTGSDGLSVATVLTSRGLISGYQHAFSLEALLTALAQQPVIVGTEWRQDMFQGWDARFLEVTAPGLLLGQPAFTKRRDSCFALYTADESTPRWTRCYRRGNRPADGPCSTSMSSDGRWLVGTYFDDVVLIDGRTGNGIRRLRFDDQVATVRFEDNDHFLVVLARQLYRGMEHIPALQNWIVRCSVDLVCEQATPHIRINDYVTPDFVPGQR